MIWVMEEEEASFSDRLLWIARLRTLLERLLNRQTFRSRVLDKGSDVISVGRCWREGLA
jgi:hypothetical protein